MTSYDECGADLAAFKPSRHRSNRLDAHRSDPSNDTSFALPEIQTITRVRKEGRLFDIKAVYLPTGLVKSYNYSNGSHSILSHRLCLNRMKQSRDRCSHSTPLQRYLFIGLHWQSLYSLKAEQLGIHFSRITHQLPSQVGNTCSHWSLATLGQDSSLTARELL